MKRSLDKIDRYLRDLDLPQADPEQHRRIIRTRVWAAMERKQSMSVQNRIRKMWLILLAVITGTTIATAVGVKVYRYHFEGVDSKGAYVFSKSTMDGETKPYQGSQTVTVAVSSDDPQPNVEAIQTTLEEIEALRIADERELRKVLDQWVNGHFFRTYIFRYTLSDGRIEEIAESISEQKESLDPEQLAHDQEEMDLLRTRGERELTRIIEHDVEGGVFRTCIYEYVLSDGRTMTVGENDPEASNIVLSLEQQNEVWRLYGLRQGEFLGELDREIEGMTFACETYLFTLEDGTVVTMAKGQRKDRRIRLTDTDWEELAAIQRTDTGEYLSTEGKEVRGQTFIFEKRRYFLSDGTEVIQAEGKPAD